MAKFPFEMVPLPEARSTKKPRKTGITMMVDFGTPLGKLEDLLGLIGPHVDLIKIAVGSARLAAPRRYGPPADGTPIRKRRSPRWLGHGSGFTTRRMGNVP